MEILRSSESLRPTAQPVATSLSRAAIFLVVTVKHGTGNRAAIRSFCTDLAALVRSVGFRELEGSLSCVVGFGSEVWDHLWAAETERAAQVSGDPRWRAPCCLNARRY